MKIKIKDFLDFLVFRSSAFFTLKKLANQIENNFFKLDFYVLFLGP